MPRRVAIVGGGVSGISCSWHLRDHDCEVDMYESDDRLGGHANSVPFTGPNGRFDVDTGFIALNEATYPHFNGFLKQLGVETMPTDMSFGVSALNGAFEWGSYSFSSFVGSFTRLFDTWFLRLLFDVIRFFLFAQDILREQPASGFESIGEYLRRKRYSNQFITYFLIPMVAAPWCIDPDEFAATFPAKNLIQFMLRHGILEAATKKLHWRTFADGSKTYVDAFRRQMPSNHRIHLNSTVKSISRHGGKASITLTDGSTGVFDHVLLAVHANQALSILGDQATVKEREILDSFRTSRNICYLHSDVTQLPRRPSARVAWNCFISDSPSSKSRRIALTFDMNKLQAIPFPGQAGSPGRVLVTMNPPTAPSSVQSTHVYYHPLISSESILGTRRLHEVNGPGSVTFAGAWMGYGFHEDGFLAGAHAAHLIMKGKGHVAPLNLVECIDEGTPLPTSLTRTILRTCVRVVQYLVVW
ncbi:hypothetical protein L249_1849 [Ophiocordyceps polyrhachis-furcata BCC 54312]|uniref:Amine oxidase domain-containing protein n=1 Tax=Ophiocordyceps polyrhachis-furcata BCC 54312 TaxID=1330021 RepID=A0A367LS08_9HYPO|nr:hypothetical protein L249_1849 [Ophiocordyceps polyrhachis-furcata BCC 54312]